VAPIADGSPACAPRRHWVDDLAPDDVEHLLDKPGGPQRGSLKTERSRDKSHGWVMARRGGDDIAEQGVHFCMAFVSKADQDPTWTVPDKS
jgi:hypothetical protein